MKERDYSIDFFKGISVLSMVFIHTVWWTGESYVPNIVAQFSLLIDVPLFFFLSGSSATFSFKKSNPFSGIIRLYLLFTIYSVIYTAFTEPFHLVKHSIDSLFLQFPYTPKLFVVFGSMWFIRIFIVVYILGFIIIKHLPKHFLPVFGLLLVYGLYQFPNLGYLNNLSLFSVKSDYLFFYLSIFIFGFYYYSQLIKWKRINQFSILLFLFSFTLLLLHFNDKPFNLQGIKFDPRFYYFIASLLSISLVMYFSKFIKNRNFITKVGENALVFYLAQGISSTLIKELVEVIDLNWVIKLIIIFTINMMGTILIASLIIFVQKKINQSISFFMGKIGAVRS